MTERAGRSPIRKVVIGWRRWNEYSDCSWRPRRYGRPGFQTYKWAWFYMAVER